MDYKQMWDTCLKELETSVSRANFNTWFRNTFVVKEEGGVIFLAVPNSFVKDWLSNKFHKLILKTFMNINGSIRTVEYIITKENTIKSRSGNIPSRIRTINKELPSKKVYYTTLEKFATDFINSIRMSNVASFKEKYKNYDTIIIDDIQFIGKMDKIQEELFHLFNVFYENRKPIIFSSDRHPNYIPGLEARLVSRFGSGMIIDINPPDYESRLAILKGKIKEMSIDLENEITEHLASVIDGNIRELEGSLNAIICQTRLKNRQLSINEVKNLIKNNIKPKKSVSIKDVVKVISNFYNLEEELLYQKTRRREIVHARQVVMYILREDFSVSYPLIGQKIGGKDHTTVIHSCGKIKEGLKNDQILTQEIEQIRVLFK